MTDIVSSGIRVDQIIRAFDFELVEEIPDDAVILIDHEDWLAPKCATPALVRAILASPDQAYISLLSQEIAPIASASRIKVYSDGSTVRMVREDGTARSVELRRADLSDLLEEYLGPDAEIVVTHPTQPLPLRLSFLRFSQWVNLGVVPDTITSWTS